MAIEGQAAHHVNPVFMNVYFWIEPKPLFFDAYA